jgi:hypothetical protein
MSTIQIKPAGSPLPKVEKYAKETIVYKLECAPLLEFAELVVNATPVDVPEGVNIIKTRAKDGTGIEVVITNDDLNSQVYQDYVITISYGTTLGNTRIASFQLRVYK